jgi:3',5'-cyclic AMP phosphodiesterase CpdA
MTEDRRTTIVQISDLHCGSELFRSELLERAIAEINDLAADVVVCSGDLTTNGFRGEFREAKEHLDRVECESLVVVPGNHDSRNVGYVHFDDFFGDSSSVFHDEVVSLVAVDSSEPDLDGGHIGRARYGWIVEQFARPATLRVFALHHHLVAVPGTGRERNVVSDAGDLLETLQRAKVNVVLCGHKHVPYAWRFENLFVVNAGTVSSLRLRGKTQPCYNIIELAEGWVTVWLKYPFLGRERILRFSLETLEYEKTTAKIDYGVTMH